jgi:hypothetical protein
MSASVRSFATATSGRGGDDGDHSMVSKSRGAKSTRTANTFGSVQDKSAYEEAGDYHDIPWWDTDFLEPPPEERRFGKTQGGEKDRYSPAHPLWPTLAHYVVMSFCVRNIVRALEKAVTSRTSGGEKIGASCVRAMNVSQLRELADLQMLRAKKEAGALPMRRVNNWPKTPPQGEFPKYKHVTHVPSEESPLRMALAHVALTGRDALNMLKFREKWQKRARQRLKMVENVSWWRTGKPLSLVRSELIRAETKANSRAKKTGDAPPQSMFGTENEFAALMPTTHDRRETIRVDLHENMSGEAMLMHPEELEDKFLELIKHQLTRMDVHLASVRYHINLGIDYDARGKILDKGMFEGRLCQMCAIM